jgi:hypothetical protein
MKIFHCNRCQQLVFFENVQCVGCQRPLAYLPSLGAIQSLEPVGDGVWISSEPGADASKYRLCANYTNENICNWAIPDDDPHALCPSCRLTRVIPDLVIPGNKEAWYRLEVAKRRLVYTLLYLGLAAPNREDDPVHGLAFEFRADDADPSGPGENPPPVLTGHDRGVITINIAEADDAEREKRRLQLHEPYRTLLGHFRHEVGHYFWDRLVNNDDRLGSFRALFGDDSVDYAQSLQDYYQRGAPANWRDEFISAYAAAHPWEDWAETWAHYLHMVDALETAAACGLSLQPFRKDEPSLEIDAAAPQQVHSPFEKMIDDWFSLTYVLNNLNRGLGLPDGYPFVLSSRAIDKLRFVHEVVNVDKSDNPHHAE